MDITELVCKALGIPTMDPSGKIGVFIGHAVEVLKDSRVAPIVIPTDFISLFHLAEAVKLEVPLPCMLFTIKDVVNGLCLNLPPVEAIHSWTCFNLTTG